MNSSQAIRLAFFTLATCGWLCAPGSALAQEGHDEAATETHELHGGQEEHDAHAVHEMNEIALFVGATTRFKFEDDETGGTVGLEYMRQIRPRVGFSIAAEWSTGDLERDWIAMFKLGIQPFDGWTRPLGFYVGTGIEVARIDEALLEADLHGEEGGEEGEGSHGADLLQEGEHHEEGERETEVDALVRIGTYWPFHAGSFSIIPTVNFDLVGEDWAMVFGIVLGYRF